MKILFSFNSSFNKSCLTDVVPHTVKYCLLSTRLKVMVCMKHWISPMSCSLRLIQHWCAPTRRTIVYRNWFRDSGTLLIQEVTARSISCILFVRVLGVSMWKRTGFSA